MFYVSEGKIYDMTPTAEGRYLELMVKDDSLIPTSKSIDHKPANRQVCTYEEVLAKFGEELEEEKEPVVVKPAVAKKSK